MVGSPIKIQTDFFNWCKVLVAIAIATTEYIVNTSPSVATVGNRFVDNIPFHYTVAHVFGHTLNP